MNFGRCKILKDWDVWDYSVHEDEKQIDRQGRSMLYPFSFNISKKKEKGIFSSSSSLPYYETTMSNCTCFDFQERGLPCKHIYRLAVELGYIEIIKRNPGGYDKKALEDIRNSGDIDSAPDQVKRQKSAAKCKIVEIDYKNKSAIFKGSGKSPYETTLESCTCRDFFVRNLPCKHIYRLRTELENIKNENK